MDRLFRSFWMAGFESASQRLCSGRRIDMLAVTQHDRQAEADYGLVAARGIRAVRDAVRWPLVDRGGQYDMSSLAPMLAAARALGVQVVWGLCHYGWPEDVDLLRPEFVDRFARYCRAVAQVVRDESDEVPFYTPVNEISFLAWATGAARFIYPCRPRKAPAIKAQLVRAAIAACEAIWDVDPRARIVHTDPAIQVIAPQNRPGLEKRARIYHEAQFEALDMLAGRREPELGGNPRYVDIIGLNYYHDNHWEVGRKAISWEQRASGEDPRWLPLHRLLEAFHCRYQRPIFLAETSHFGNGRAAWLRMVAGEVRRAREIGVPVHGICIYPIIDRPDWANHRRWHHSGLWEVEKHADGELKRVLNQEYGDELERLMRVVPGE
jgi:beta-glucosidase/6-phospho-beta-glucosidase/beta-galactosidase